MIDDTTTIGIVAAVVSLLTAVSVKLIEKIFSVGEKRIDDAASIRQELRDEVHVLRAELRDQRKTVQESSQKIYKLTIENIRLKEQYTTLNTEYHMLEKKYKRVTDELQTLRTRLNQ